MKLIIFGLVALFTYSTQALSLQKHDDTIAGGDGGVSRPSHEQRRS